MYFPRRQADDSRRSADAAFELAGHHAGAAADVAFCDGSRSCLVERFPDMLTVHMLARDVIEQRIRGLRDDRQAKRFFQHRRGGKRRLPHEITASRTTPTESVLVIGIGDSSSPDSCTQ